MLIKVVADDWTTKSRTLLYSCYIIYVVKITKYCWYSQTNQTNSMIGNHPVN